MAQLTVVSNAGPLIALSSIRQLDVLRRLFGSIVIPDAVYREVVLNGQGRPGQNEVEQAAWITIEHVTSSGISNLMLDKLDAGERESIALAYDLKADYILLDERLARRRANLLGLTVIGTLGILLMAHKDQHIHDIATLLSELEQNAFRMNTEVKAHILRKAGELRGVE